MKIFTKIGKLLPIQCIAIDCLIDKPPRDACQLFQFPSTKNRLTSLSFTLQFQLFISFVSLQKMPTECITNPLQRELADSIIRMVPLDEIRILLACGAKVNRMPLPRTSSSFLISC